MGGDPKLKTIGCEDENDMTKYSLVAFSGSPSPNSKTALLAEFALGLAAGRNVEVRHYRVSALSPTALLSGDLQNSLLREMIDAMAGAHGVIIATPIFKAAYSGLLKAFLDARPSLGSPGRRCCRSPRGVDRARAGGDYALRPVLQSMGAQHSLKATSCPKLIWKSLPAP